MGLGNGVLLDFDEMGPCRMNGGLNDLLDGTGVELPESVMHGDTLLIN